MITVIIVLEYVIFRDFHPSELRFPETSEKHNADFKLLLFVEKDLTSFGHAF